MRRNKKKDKLLHIRQISNKVELRQIRKEKKAKSKYLRSTVLFIILIVSTVSAEDFTITDPVEINLDNGSYITLLPGQTGINMTVFNNIDSPASTLRVNLIGSQAYTTTDANVSISNLTYSVPGDNLSYVVNGTANLNMTARMELASTQYQVLRNLSDDGTVISTSNRLVTVIRTISGELDYIIKRMGAPAAIGGNPVLTFTDASCLGGMICTSTVHIYSGNNEIGSLNSTGSYINLNTGGNTLNITLEESELGQLNNQDETREMFKKTWAELTIILLTFGIIIAAYFILKNIFTRR